MALPPHTPLVLLAAIVGSSVGFFVWVFRDAPGARPLAAFLIAASLWSLAEGIALASPTLGGKVFWSRLAWTVSPLVPLAWLATVLAYADYDWTQTRSRLGLLFLEPIAFVALIWTNADHGLVWTEFSTRLVDGYVVLVREFGVGFWAHTAYAYVLVAVGALVLVRLNFRTNQHFRSQGTALLLAVFVPMLALALSVFRVVPPQFDLTSIGFVVTGLVVTGAMFHRDLLSVAPVTRELGREAVVDEIGDPVVIVDSDDRVVDCNPAAERLFDVGVDDAIGDPLAAVSEPLADCVADLDAGQVDFERDGANRHRYFDVRVSSLYRAYGTVTGRVVSLRDVTRRRQREQRLDVLNRLLRHNLRNEMNVVGGNAELLEDHLDTDDPVVTGRLETIQSTVETIVRRSDKVGYLSRQLDGESSTTSDLDRIVADASASVRERAPHATITADVPRGTVVAGGRSLELAVEELLSNAVEHNDGPEPTVEVTATSDGESVELRVADDGPGIARQERVVIEEGRETALEHGSGIGLWLVAWAVREYGGSVAFENRDDGCTVVLSLPVSDQPGQTEPAQSTVGPVE